MLWLFAVLAVVASSCSQDVVTGPAGKAVDVIGSQFDIVPDRDIWYLEDDVPENFKRTVERAVAVWSDMIVYTGPPHHFQARSANTERGFPAIGTHWITSFKLAVTFELESNEYEALGGVMYFKFVEGPREDQLNFIRPRPLIGFLRFDGDFFSSRSEDVLYQTVLHEMGHALGFGSFFFDHDRQFSDSWSSWRLLSGSPSRYFFLGRNARNHYYIFNNSGVPLSENGRHWPQNFVDIMTPRFVEGRRISILTAAALADMGYIVDDKGVAPFRIDIEEVTPVAAKPAPSLDIVRCGLSSHSDLPPIEVR